MTLFNNFQQVSPVQEGTEQNEDVEEESAELDIGVSINSLGKVFSVSFQCKFVLEYMLYYCVLS